VRIRKSLRGIVAVRVPLVTEAAVDAARPPL
jgi:hypothetical protein